MGRAVAETSSMDATRGALAHLIYQDYFPPPPPPSYPPAPSL